MSAQSLTTMQTTKTRNNMELQTNFQKRVAFSQGLRMRENEETPKIEGVAIVVNQETILYENAEWREIEVIDPACINKEVIDNEDIKLNLLHERSSSFARSKQREGSLDLDTREDGLHFSTPIPDCDLGQRAKALIDNGTYTGCSFEFWPKDYTVEERDGKDGKKEYVVRHTKFGRIGAITIGMDPAYEQTSVGLREMYREAHIQDDPDERKRQLEEAAKRERELTFTREMQDIKRQIDLM